MDALPKHVGLYTEMYQLSMAQAYLLNGWKEEPAGFYYFSRKNPFKGGYVLFAGLHDLLEVLEGLQFHEEAIEYLRENGFHKDFLQYLKDFYPSIYFVSAEVYFRLFHHFSICCRVSVKRL